MHLPYVLGVLEDPYLEEIMGIIIYIPLFIIEHTDIFPPHLLSKLKPEVSINAVAAILCGEFITGIIQIVYLSQVP